MTAAPAMQEFLTHLITKYDEAFFVYSKERRLRLELDRFPALLLVVNDDTVSLAHEELYDGEVMLNPEVLFSTINACWPPIYSSRPATLDRYYARLDWKTGGLIVVPGTEEGQNQEALCCDAWARELERQGWLQRATPVRP